MFCCFGSRNKKIQIDSSTRPPRHRCFVLGQNIFLKFSRLTPCFGHYSEGFKRNRFTSNKKSAEYSVLMCACDYLPNFFRIRFEKKNRMPSSFRNNDLLLAIKCKIESRTFNLFHSLPPFLTSKKKHWMWTDTISKKKTSNILQVVINMVFLVCFF